MTTTNVTASGGNDTSAIQAAIDAANSGDTIDFAAGDYNLDGVTLKSGVTYHGEAGATLHATGSNPVFSVNSGDSHDITIDSLHFVGTGADPTSGVVDLSGTGAANSVDHITLSNSSFDNNGLTFDFVKNSQIVNDHFSNIQGTGTGIHGYHMDNSTIGGDVFTNDYQGIGLIFGGADNQGRNVVVADNVGTGMSRMGVEIIGSDPVYQGETTNLLVKGNSFTNWGTPSADGETTAYSIVTDGGTGTHIVDNYAQGSHNSGYGIEMSGVGAVADGNYIDGFSTGVIGYSSQDVIQNNNIINYSSAATSTYTQTDEIVQNNTSDPSLAHPTSGSGTAVASDPTSSGSGTVVASDPTSTQTQPTHAPAPDASSHAAGAGGTTTLDHTGTAPVDHTGTGTGSLPGSTVPVTSGADQASTGHGSGTVVPGTGHDAFVLPTGSNQGSTATHATTGADSVDPSGTLGSAAHPASGAVGTHVVDSAYHAAGATLAAAHDGSTATHGDVTLQHILPSAHAHTDYMWHH